MSDVFENDGQHVGDDQWIRFVANEGWIALTKDASIISAHTETLESTSIRLFALPNSNLTGPQMAERFSANLHRIVQRARKPGPYVYVVQSRGIERRWPPPS